jgi:dihydroorotate dehydrogenase (fumarate)
MNLATRYLGFTLPHPLIPGASPLADELDGAKRLEDAGAPMIVLRSLFEEQLVHEQFAAQNGIDAHENSFAEALSYFPSTHGFRFGPDSYAEHVARLKGVLGVPVVASINGTTLGGWVEYARLLQAAGADALELNLFLVPTDPEEGAVEIEDRLLALIRAVRANVTIPLAVKLSPFYTSLPNFVRRVESEGADGVIVFNRFYEPDIDVRNQQVVRTLTLSSPTELLARLHALAIVSGRTRLSLAVSGGVHTGLDALKAVLCGADGVQMVSALLKEGPEQLMVAREQLREALETNEFESLAQAKGSMGLTRCPDPKVYSRVNYMRILQNWRG